MSTTLDAVRGRRSWSKVTDEAPSHEELLELVQAAGRVADHSNLKPWRLIEIRGDDRITLGRALAKADGSKGVSSKPMRAPLLIAVVGNYRKKHKVPEWEQEVAAAGVAHTLSLLLDDAGWGVFWRTGDAVRSKAVAKAHKLRKNEKLLGWLYVGGKPGGSQGGSRRSINASEFVSRMPRGKR